MRGQKSVTFADAKTHGGAGAGQTAAALDRLAHTGQVIYDLAAGVYRWRQVMPMELGEEQIGPESPELVAARGILAKRGVKIDTHESTPAGGLMLGGTSEGKTVAAQLNADGLIKQGRCECTYHFKNGIRKGPCRHILALRDTALGGGESAADTDAWYDRLLQWAAS